MSLTEFADRFIGLPEVMATTNIRAKSTIYRLINENDFPAPYPITKSRRAWSMREVQEWIAARKRAI